jgi:hypothetical protein
MYIHNYCRTWRQLGDIAARAILQPGICKAILQPDMCEGLYCSPLRAVGIIAARKGDIAARQMQKGDIAARQEQKGDITARHP